MVPRPKSVEAKDVRLFGGFGQLLISAVLRMKLNTGSDSHLRNFEPIPVEAFCSSLHVICCRNQLALVRVRKNVTFCRIAKIHIPPDFTFALSFGFLGLAGIIAVSLCSPQAS